MRTPNVGTFWCKNSEFFEIYDVAAQAREVESVRTFFEQGERSIFRDFVRTSLWTVNNTNLI